MSGYIAFGVTCVLYFIVLGSIIYLSNKAKDKI